MFPRGALRRTAVTLVELLVVIAIIGLLVGLLLPALAAAREAARKATCQSHLKQIGLALATHEGAFRQLPVGAQGGGGSTGVSWWAALLPFLEQTPLHETLDLAGNNAGSPLLHGLNGGRIDGVRLEVMLCPSSPLDPFWPVAGLRIEMPSYVGVAGASRDGGFPETRVSACCSGDANSGQISAGGLLVPNRAIQFREIKDGTSTTIAVGEASDSALDASRTTHRIDGGNPIGWLTGTSAAGTPPGYVGSMPGVTPASWNITTIRYAPNTRNYSLPGIDDNHGANNPLLSAHPGGVYVLLCDGSVQFLDDAIDVGAFKQMATRDDGQVNF